MARSGVELKDVDKGAATLRRRAAAAALRENVLTVGIHEHEGSAPKKEREAADSGDAKSAGQSEGPGGSAAEAPPTLAEVASFHEFGLGVPRRSFIADWADENRALHEKQLRKMAQAVLAGKVESIEIGFSRLGSLFVGQVQKRIADGIDPPLAPSTIAAKGSSKPLIDTGQLRTAVKPYLNGQLIE